MKTINLTREKIALVDDVDHDELNRNSWSYSNTGYAQRGFKIKGKSRTVLMHRQILNAPSGIEVDHINGNRLDNRRSNLRFATRGENIFNQRKRLRKTTSQYKGVYWNKGDSMWMARIQAKGNCIYLGNFRSEQEAALAYNTAATKYHGEYANLNIILEENKDE